ncbi:hypothetical protein [Microvirga sp. TS319]|uniref:hypothetical protein n=1 Tax=Microvirga sp. TS319 TaxID=3241165 RepID=UPI00351A2C15
MIAFIIVMAKGMFSAAPLAAPVGPPGCGTSMSFSQAAFRIVVCLPVHGCSLLGKSASFLRKAGSTFRNDALDRSEPKSTIVDVADPPPTMAGFL